MQHFNLSPYCIKKINEMLIKEMSKIASKYPSVPNVRYNGSGRMTYTFIQEGSVYIESNRECATEANTKYFVDSYAVIGSLVNAENDDKTHRKLCDELYNKMIKYATRFHNESNTDKVAIERYYRMGHSAISLTKNIKFGRLDFTSSFYD